MALSLAQRILASKRAVILFHTWTVTRQLLARAIREQRSMDLDVCITDAGDPYLGHAQEYHAKTKEPFFESMRLWEAVQELAESNTPVIVDCKHFDAWPVVEEVVRQLRPERCLVHSFVFELKFDAGRTLGEPDFLCEWSPIERLEAIKRKFPLLTTSASAKWLPVDVLVSPKREAVLEGIAKLLEQYHVDTVCLNVPDSTFSNPVLRTLLQHGIIAHVGVDRIDTNQLSEIYIGETDRLEFASRTDLL
jgi:hypothetical protein